MKRDRYPTKTIRLVGILQRDTAIKAIENCPIDSDAPVEVVIRDEKKGRKLSQNDLMWAGPLCDIAAEAYIEGRTFSAEVWHEFFKREFLPEAFDHELTKEGYQKWDTDPAGERVLIGSTTELTVYGFSQYLEQIHAYGVNLGVMFVERRAA